MSIKRVGKRLRLGAMLCGLVLGGLCLVGCRSHAPTRQSLKGSTSPTSTSATSAVTTPASTPSAVLAGTNSGAPEPEVFRIGNSLTITFMDTPTPIPPFEGKIKEDGTITLTLNQTFKADGKTRGELEKDIRERYVPNYFKYLTVTVKQDVNTQWYYVYGEVRTPDRRIYNSRMTVLKAIVSAGGFTDFANKKNVQLTRLDGRTQIVNCVKAQTKPTLDPEVYPGDTILVRRRLW
jgi:protein involved in polysaccharide export with SLBB domain